MKTHDNYNSELRHGDYVYTYSRLDLARTKGQYPRLKRVEDRGKTRVFRDYHQVCVNSWAVRCVRLNDEQQFMMKLAGSSRVASLSGHDDLIDKEVAVVYNNNVFKGIVIAESKCYVTIKVLRSNTYEATATIRKAKKLVRLL